MSHACVCHLWLSVPRLREAASFQPQEERALLKRFKGIGDMGADIFLTEAQLAWREAFPAADRKSLGAAEALGLGSTAQDLAHAVALYNQEESAETELDAPAADSREGEEEEEHAAKRTKRQSAASSSAAASPSAPAGTAAAARGDDDVLVSRFVRLVAALTRLSFAATGKHSGALDELLAKCD